MVKGKTTLSKQLAELLKISHIELDSIQHGPNWVQCEKEEFVRQACQRMGLISQQSSSSPTTQERVVEWVVDGNYNAVRDIVWDNASLIIWLDYELSVIFPRLFYRIMK